MPAIVICSYVRPGTVFRAPDGSPPYDHTSILASLRDWLGLTGLTNLAVKLKEWWFAKNGTKYPFLPSPRIKAAPTFWPVLSLSTADNPWPEIKATCRLDVTDADLETPLSDVQKSLLATARRQVAPEGAVAIQQETAIEAKQQITYSDALTYLHPET